MIRIDDLVFLSIDKLKIRADFKNDIRQNMEGNRLIKYLYDISKHCGMFAFVVKPKYKKKQLQNFLTLIID